MFWTFDDDGLFLFDSPRKGSCILRDAPRAGLLEGNNLGRYINDLPIIQDNNFHYLFVLTTLLHCHVPMCVF